MWKFLSQKLIQTIVEQSNFIEDEKKREIDYMIS